jgi:hypothetical protein
MPAARTGSLACWLLGVAITRGVDHVAPPSSERDHATACVPDTAIHAATRSFAPTGSMAAKRREHTATLLPTGNVLMTGGYTTDSFTQSSAELFDWSASFTPTGSMPANRAGHTATLLPSGRVLVAGGFDNMTILSSAELYALPSGAPCAVADD